MSDVRRFASVRPMSSGAGIEWLPDVGVPWHVVHGPGSVSMPESSFSPLTSVIRIGLELKRISHRATAARAALRPWSSPPPSAFARQLSYKLNAAGLNAAPVL